MIVEQYWAGIARRLQLESGMLNSLIPHAVTKGAQNELTLARMIEHLAPPGIGIGSGVLFDHHGASSPQMDIVLFDVASQPQLMAQTNQVMYPVETVRMVIEVKTTLSSQDIIKDFPGKKRRLSTLRPLDGFKMPPFGLFAYTFGDSDYGRASDLYGLSSDDRPDIGCVVTPGFSFGTDTCGFVPLLDDKYEFVTPESATDPTVFISGAHYPVYMLGKYTGDRFVGDPGRALLLFCMSLLDLLDGQGRYSWVNAYAGPSVKSLQSLPESAI